MSWTSGASLMREWWPALEKQLKKPNFPIEFLEDLLALFLKNDTRPEELAEIHPRIREVLLSISVELNEESDSLEEDLKICCNNLHSGDEKTAIDAAQAIEFYVAQANNVANAGIMAQESLIAALNAKSVKVRRAISKVLFSMSADRYPLSETSEKRFRDALNDDDQIVKTKLEKAGKRFKLL